MGDRSGIEWTEATWNPVTGCSKVSQGCKNCYALRDWTRLSANPKTVYYGRAFTDVMVHPERLDQPLRWRKPRMIFVNSMSDLFHESIPDDFIKMVLLITALAPQHTFQVLTKRPERMRAILSKSRQGDFFGDSWARRMRKDPYCKKILAEREPKPFRWPPDNLWLGVSCEDQETADARIPLLLGTPAAVRWVSAEPLLGSIDLRRVGVSDDVAVRSSSGRWIDWVVVGGESGPRARPMNPDWARSIRDQCRAAGVRFFMKQMWGKSKRSMPPIPEDLMIRESPSVV